MIRIDRLERAALILLAVLFCVFTAYSPKAGWSGDDMMNLFTAWTVAPWKLFKAVFYPWMGVYRPFGGEVYVILYKLFGFTPTPLYVLSWLVMIGNVFLGYAVCRAISLSRAAALAAVAITLVHGDFQDLYLNAGTMYDKFWYTFTAIAVILYIRARRDADTVPLSETIRICLLMLLAIGSKESGVVLPALLAAYELLYIWPERRKLRAVAPLYGAMAVIALLMIFIRVPNTRELANNGAYAPKASAGLWIANVAEYLSKLIYHAVQLPPFAAALLLVALLGIALALRNRAMLFGWLWFVVTITPMSVVSVRQAYVLYVPILGVGIYLGELLSVAVRRFATEEKQRMAELAATAVLATIVLYTHHRVWPDVYHWAENPEAGFSSQFRTMYPKMAPGSKLLFLSDYFPEDAFDLQFNTQLLYGDTSFYIRRVHAKPDQQPDPKKPVKWDHIFVAESGRYIELDNRDPERSIRWHIVRDYTPGRDLEFARRDHVAYLISGVRPDTVVEEGHWIKGDAQFKFDLYPTDYTLTMRYWLPDFVVKSGARTLHVLINGQEAATVTLAEDNAHDLKIPVPASMIGPLNELTRVELKIDNPYKGSDGEEFGLVLIRAAFDYATPIAENKKHAQRSRTAPPHTRP